jgi:hypothetical protein
MAWIVEHPAIAQTATAINTTERIRLAMQPRIMK